MKGLLHKVLKLLSTVEDSFYNFLLDKSEIKPKQQDNTTSNSDENKNAEAYTYTNKYSSSEDKFSNKVIDDAYASYNVSLWDEEDYYIK
ncbi:hypothetical protein [Intestinibacter bartlettii]|uniref:Uncharacterized protein n=1 Tax=Intestinibacter bartlettii TaxID=261299 RepID=A0ABS6DUQ4_9FIRM|nr:hypothetical protein [Intestinibacter bartlettii]MBU5335480.1 hypothetical protein [Intestinibacter bartlettii]